MDANVSAVLSLTFGFWEPSHDPTFTGDASLQFLISLLASHFAFYVENVLYLCEGLKSVFWVDDELAELGCIAV